MMNGISRAGRSLLATLLAITGLVGATQTAAQEIKVGLVLSTTGPAASLGIPEQNSVSLLPKEIGGHKVSYIVLNDASDSTTAVTNAKKLIIEDKVDVIIGSTLSPNSLAMIEPAAESETPMVSIAGASRIVEPLDAKRRWVFKITQHDHQMAHLITRHMAESGIKTLGYIGQNDAYGEGWWNEIKKEADARKISIVASERFNRTDTSVTAQVLKVVAANPDAVIIVGAGTPAAMPQKALKERGYRKPIYQTHGVANSDFLRVCGKDCEGMLLPAGPVLVAHQLPASHPTRKSALAYAEAYEAAYGKGTVSTFGGHVWDAAMMVQEAAKAALKRAKPGTREFRAALRDGLENLRELPVSHGIVNTSATDHQGLDERSRVMVQVDNGTWKYLR